MTNPVRLIYAGLVAGLVFFAGCGGGGDAKPPVPGTLQSLSISLMATPELGISPLPPMVRQRHQFAVNAIYDNLVTEDVTTKCAWSTTNTAAGTINANGQFTLVGAGDVAVKARYNGVEATQPIFTNTATYTNSSGTAYVFYWYGTRPIANAWITEDAVTKVVTSNAAY